MMASLTFLLIPQTPLYGFSCPLPTLSHGPGAPVMVSARVSKLTLNFEIGHIRHLPHSSQVERLRECAAEK